MQKESFCVAIPFLARAIYIKDIRFYIRGETKMTESRTQQIDDTPVVYTLEATAFKMMRSVSTVRRLIKEKLIEAVWIAGQQQVTHEELMRFIKSGDGVQSRRGHNAKTAVKTRWHGKGTATKAPAPAKRRLAAK